MTSSQGFLSHIFLHASAAEKVKRLATFEDTASVLSQFFMGGVTVAAGGQIQSRPSELKVKKLKKKNISYSFKTSLPMLNTSSQRLCAKLRCTRVGNQTFFIGK